MSVTGLVPAESLDAYCRAPVGRWFQRGAVLLFSPRAGLGSISVVRSLDEKDHELIEELVSRPELWLPEVILDASALTTLDDLLTARLVAMLGRRPAGAPMPKRVAIVVSQSPAGAVVVGIPRLLGLRGEWRALGDLGSAMAWMGVDAELVEPLLARARDTEPLLTDLAHHLIGAKRYSLAGAARSLGMSPRSLQRALAALGTSFARESRRHAVARAMSAMRAAERPIAAIAREAGYASLASFTAMFTREVGTTPSRWRREQAGARP